MEARFAFRALAVTTAILFFGARAGAQSASDKAAAEALFDQGRSAMQEGDFGKACGLLERSQPTAPGIGTLLYLAECYEKSGRTASAWATFREAADAADRTRESGRARTGRDRAARLEPLLSRLSIQVAPEATQIPGITIERSGKPVQAALYNVPVPVDPGDYQITANAPGYEGFSQVVTVGEKAARASVTVPSLKKLESDKALTAIAPADALKPSASPEPGAPPAPSPDSVGKGQRTTAYVLGGVGAAGIVVGSIFGLQAISKNKDAEQHCPRGYKCDDADGPALAEQARNAARVSTIAFGVGAVALGGGAVLFFTSPRGGGSVAYGISPTGVVVRGSFQ